MVYKITNSYLVMISIWGQSNIHEKEFHTKCINVASIVIPLMS